jgi:hypothetical protein
MVAILLILVVLILVLEKDSLKKRFARRSDPPVVLREFKTKTGVTLRLLEGGGQSKEYPNVWEDGNGTA